jgi:O-antigen/teichoic acid export membrane protein
LGLTGEEQSGVARPAPGRLSLAVNSVAQSTPKLLAYLLSFASAPIVVSGLGLRGYGIWALTGALAQYAMLIDLGTGISLARYIAANAEDDRRCGQYLAIGWISVVAVTAMLAVAVLPAAAIVSDAIGGIAPGQLRIVLWSSTALICCSLLTAVITALPLGRRRMVVPNIGIAIGSVLNFIASVGSIALGAHLTGYAVANAGAGAVSVLILAAFVVRAEGRLPLGRPRRADARDFFAYAIKSQVVRCMDLVNFQTDKIVIGFSVGVRAAGAYELANRAAIAVRQVGIDASSAIDIELTAVWHQSGLAAVRARYKRFTELAASLGFPAVILMMAVAPLLLRAWLAHAPPTATAVLVALCAAYLTGVSTVAGYAVAIAAGEPGIVARTSLAAAGANIVLTAGLAPLFGIWGVLAGTVVALGGGSLAQVVMVHRRFGLPLSAYTDAVVPALGFFGLAAAPVAALAYAAPVHSRLSAAALLAVLAGAYLLACGAWAARAGRLPGAVLRLLARRRWLVSGR